MKISTNELKRKNKNEFYEDGYRIVYFYSDGTYKIDTFCKSIEGFMIEFCDEYPILDEESIPKFQSVDDLLTRYLLSYDDIISVALYKTDGTCIEKKERELQKK